MCGPDLNAVLEEPALANRSSVWISSADQSSVASLLNPHLVADFQS